MPKGFSSWEEMYQKIPVEELSWYCKNLDSDLENELNDRGINSGKFLDLGTGPGTQAMALEKRGFDVTGTDVSPTIIKKAKKLVPGVKFLVDDILDSKLSEKFDYIFDRGVFHVLEISDRDAYVHNIKKLLKPKGMLFLKCFSNKEDGIKGPKRISSGEIRDVFGKDFELKKIYDTFFEGISDRKPKALFAVMVKKS